MPTQPEPWLRGPIPAIHPMAEPFVYSLMQAREDLRHWTEGLTAGQIWARPGDLAPIGFHIRHIGGSVERLITYLKGEQLTERQTKEMKSEMEPGATIEELFREMEDRLAYAEAVVTALDPRTWTDPRTVGRRQLPTTVGGLVTHIAEHTQRHVGEAIVTAKVVRAG
jgi:uncharacterized damage-inducible protein DinB